MQKSNLLSLDEAIRKIKLSFDKISSEDVFIQNALGRCLSKPVVSNIDIQNMMYLLWTVTP